MRLFLPSSISTGPMIAAKNQSSMSLGDHERVKRSKQRTSRENEINFCQFARLACRAKSSHQRRHRVSRCQLLGRYGHVVKQKATARMLSDEEYLWKQGRLCSQDCQTKAFASGRKDGQALVEPRRRHFFSAVVSTDAMFSRFEALFDEAVTCFIGLAWSCRGRGRCRPGNGEK